MRSTRAFSLLEMLIVLALLTALSALVLPALGGRVAATTVAAAGRSLLGAAATARARAVASGEAVALVEVKGEAGPARLYSDIVLVATAGERGAEAGAAGGAGPVLSERAELLFELPRECRVSLEPPGEEVQTDPADDATGSDEPSPSAPSVSRLVIFLPDGSAVRPAPIYLVARGVAVFRCDLGVCTGRATLSLVESEEPPPPEEPDAEPLPPLEPEGGDVL